MTDRRLSEIWVYPVKSLSGIRVTQAEVLEKGLKFDRRFMLIDSGNRFITQREHPELALFQTEIHNSTLRVTQRASQETISFSLEPLPGKLLTAAIWRDEVSVSEVDEQLNVWFSDALKLPCKLVHFPEVNHRPVDPAYALHNEQVSLADGYPFLIIGQASLDDLNTRLDKPVAINRFRPNFVFTGGRPYEEDGWRNFSIGSLRFVGVKNCSRCVLITVDPETGTKGREPLRTLSTYRKKGGKTFFGQNVLAINNGTVTVGEPITL